MSARPDLASVRKIAALELEAQSRDVVLALCDHAARLEREAEGLRAGLERIRDMPGADDAGTWDWMAGRIAAAALLAAAP